MSEDVKLVCPHCGSTLFERTVTDVVIIIDEGEGLIRDEETTLRGDEGHHKEYWYRCWKCLQCIDPLELSSPEPLVPQPVESVKW